MQAVVGFCACGVSTDDLNGAPAAERIQRGRPHPFGIHLDRDRFGPHQGGGVAHPGIGQFLDRDRGPFAGKTGLKHQPDRVLPAIDQHHILRASGPQHPVAQPVDDRRAQRGFGILAWIVEPMRPHPVGHAAQRTRKRRQLPPVRQLGRPEVDDARIRDRHAKHRPPAALRTHEGAAPDLARQQPVLRDDLVGPRDRAGRHPQPPRQVAHRRQPRALGQIARPHRLAQRQGQRLILGPVMAGKVGTPNCIGHKFPLSDPKDILYQFNTTKYSLYQHKT